MAAKKKKAAGKKKPTKAELQLAQKLFARAAANAQQEDGGPPPENASQLSKLDETRLANRKRIAELHAAMKAANDLSWDEVLVGVDIIRRMAMEDGEYGPALAASKMLVDHLPQKLSATPTATPDEKPMALPAANPLDIVKLLKERGVQAGQVIDAKAEE